VSQGEKKTRKKQIKIVHNDNARKGGKEGGEPGVSGPGPEKGGESLGGTGIDLVFLPTFARGDGKKREPWGQCKERKKYGRGREELRTRR